MKKRNNRFLAGTLAGLMMLTMLPVTALAAQEGADGNAASDTPNNNIVNVVSDGKNVQQAENNDVNITANGGTENVQEFADDSSGGSDDTAAPAPQEGENSGSGSSGESAPTPVAKIGTQTYETLEEAISVAQNGDTIEVGQDITVGTDGLTINGKGNLTIKSAEGTEPTITLSGLGMYFNETDVTFQNIKVVEEGVTDSPMGGGTTNLFDDSILTFDNSTLALHGVGEGSKRHGMYLYQSSDMYVTNNSKIIISGFNQAKASGIYIDDSENDAAGETIHNKIEVTNSSSIKITDCAWNGMTVNPTDVKIDGHSTIDISDCGKNGGRGGFGCYYGSVEISDYSSLIADDNVGRSWGAFVRDVSVDSTSSLSACGNTAYGLEIGDKLGDQSKFATGSTVTLNNNGKAGLLVYTSAGYWYGNVKIEEGVKFTASGNANGIEILPEGILDMQDGTVTLNHNSSYGGGLYNRGGTAKIGGKAEIYNNHADVAGDDIYSNSLNKNKVTYNPSLTFAPVGDGWILDNCNDPIVGWYHDGKEKLTDNAYKRWNGDGEGDAYYAEEYTVGKEAVSEALALKAAHGQLCSVTYEVTGDIPSDAGAVPAAAKVKKGGSYTVAPVQTTSQSRYTFSGWRINGSGDVVTEIKDIQQDVKLIGVWTRRSSGGGGGSSKPTVDIPDDVPTGLNGDDHFAYIVGYPNGNVEPNGNITRAEVATIFFRLLTEEVRTANSTQSNSLSDVTRGQWFNHAVSTLSSMGIVKGHNDGTFAPNAPITRAEFAAIAARFDDKNTDTSSKFTDIASHWAKNEIGIAANKGWINGYPDGTFRPNQYITRAEAMTLVNRVLNRLPENSSDLLDSMIKWPDNSDASAWYYLAVQEATNSHAYSDKSKDDKYEKWTTIRDARDWTELEK
ncbi:hypothetical protein DW223_01155 [Butyricicoccus sp. AM18-35]|nr:S-layer homology domain-containing protein [Butyricicoccus sp. AM18-35]RHO18853.1 hypothetical protein DW223_01155 [Butyricicoccus sp. AM18-35]